MTEMARLQRGVRLPRTERRAQLLTAAQRVFAEHGYHAAAMDEIAEEAGVSKPVLYQHFPGKLDLYIALLESHVDDLVGRVQGALNSTTDNRQRVPATVGAFFDFVNNDAGAFRMVFESDLRGEPAVQEAVDRATSASVEAITETITSDAGLDEEKARLLAVGLVGMSQVSARYWLQHNQSMSREDAVALTANLAWRGIGGGFPLKDN
ncbi:MULTISPECIES: TetR/AcrR family transcriptional regulator [Actinomycetes]|uniref:TetR family transcriptional regulator n=2 Tax=Amycolatopsis TaxID=1813 RepID=A0A2N3WCW0_9PSEU|nr:MULTISPECIES: TetR/AcrR family transcriptional regulator [Actinomycetes]ATY09716.1 TetR/AcrR family transcriptional regulator [Amycolatopsis sp. AA4]EFL05105.1 transcriptional regulator [Streptomyces sp. AA4]MBB1157484.1 TetR/AcrR family transcriptional regulator [Amycolatopsis dendrobii]MBB2506372.1 TetR/AcrR family transcriptional regulator [Amycolatopsis echigonensis]MCG3757559.1 TetR/AcrR family transcriptional regulator [Amycolatopsis sp. Poz14]